MSANEIANFIDTVGVSVGMLIGLCWVLGRSIRWTAINVLKPVVDVVAKKIVATLDQVIASQRNIETSFARSQLEQSESFRRMETMLSDIARAPRLVSPPPSPPPHS